MRESLWKRVSELPLEIDSYELERLAQPVTRGLDRVTTVVRLRGDGHEGEGEDVTWYTEAHEQHLAAGPVLPLAGSWTLESFSASLGVDEPWRRWAYESAALDLGLRQSDRSFADALGREPRPVSFVASPGLGAPPTVAPVQRFLDLYPELRFKLDPSGDWTDQLIAELDATGAVVTVDLKAYYAQDDVPPDPELYRRVAEGLPDALIEDPAQAPETLAVLEPHRERVTWDAPIHSVADVEGLPFRPRMLNSKPSRFGTLRALLDFYDWTEAEGIALYGGGMFELGPGRGQIQYLASLFHPDAPNDVAPGGYNAREPQADLPRSPLPRPGDDPGFRARLY